MLRRMKHQAKQVCVSLKNTRIAIVTVDTLQTKQTTTTECKQKSLDTSQQLISDLRNAKHCITTLLPTNYIMTNKLGKQLRQKQIHNHT